MNKKKTYATVQIFTIVGSFWDIESQHLLRKGQYNSAPPVHFHRDIGPAVRVFANGLGDLGSIPGRVIPKDFKNGT